MARNAADIGDYFKVDLSVLLDQSSILDTDPDYSLEYDVVDEVYNDNWHHGGQNYIEESLLEPIFATETFDKQLNVNGADSGNFYQNFNSFQDDGNYVKVFFKVRYTNLPRIELIKEVIINIIDCSSVTLDLPVEPTKRYVVKG